MKTKARYCVFCESTMQRNTLAPRQVYEYTCPTCGTKELVADRLIHPDNYVKKD